ncbi:MAG: metalloprotease PmbA [Burkholderiales bacterium]|jgi:PmbA protein|nr:metalloprotease PmbA [Burkholderiales bacterium]
MFEYDTARLHEIAARGLEMARRLGATDASVDISESSGLSVNVRKGSVETIEQTRDKGVGITVYVGKRRGHASTSDFADLALSETVAAAFEIARYTGEDDCAGLPDADQLATDLPELDLFHPWQISVEEAVDLACRMEGAAFATSPLIRNSEGASVSVTHGHFVAANSLGFAGGYPYSRHSIGCSPIAQRGQSMQRDDWYSSSLMPARLADPVKVGRYAAERALSRLGARQVDTCKVPVLFEAPLACGLLGSFVQAVSGGSLYRRSSFLLDSLGKDVFAPHIDLVEDAHLPAEMGSSPFDSEGVRTGRRTVVSAGRLHGYFLSTYSARKLGMKTTGNAGGSHNLTLSSRLTRQLDDLPAMLERLGTGLFVTDLMGQGVNGVTGDYSRGASGFWVENGVIAYPVEEITIAGNLADMFKGIVAIGGDVIQRGGKRTGSILIDRMAVAGA